MAARAQKAVAEARKKAAAALYARQGISTNLIQRYDRNGNGILEQWEAARIREDRVKQRAEAAKAGKQNNQEAK